MPPFGRFLKEVFAHETGSDRSCALHRQQAVYLKLMVDENDLGKVIGKQGRIAKAVRTIVRAVANRENKRVIVDILENDGEEE